MSVRVVARIRPLLSKELDRDTIVSAASADENKAPTLVKIPNPKNESEKFSFAFNSVYDQSTSQEALFTTEVAPHVKSLFQGFDVTIFAYGVTGTGKTHTMRGGLKLADRGVIPRLLSNIFRRSKKIAKDTDGQTTVNVALSYYEIYNDKVFDLLEPPEKRQLAGLPLREKDGKTIVVGLSERSCQDLKDFEKLYIEANNNRVTAATKLNAHSSRSHAILRVKVTQTTGDTVRESTASAIDLAGSEDNRRTDNGKERLVESAAINKSLFVLSQCVDAISRGDKRIPYRESKMTRILSLGQNNGITVMILNLAPLRSYHLDTLSSLNVSSRAKRIEVREIENEVVFKQVPRTNSENNGAGIARQPLRPLANAHNVNAGVVATEKAKDKETSRPVKAFSVYADRAKPPSLAASAQISAPSRPSANTAQVRKRASDSNNISRPSKVARAPLQALQPVSNHVNHNAIGVNDKLSISPDQLEALVEKKVSDILAARTKEAPEPVPAPSHPDINEAVQRRLEALEKRIQQDERREDGKSEGLRYLLSARQAKERGDDPSALQMYELALPFFPGQAKLMGKIERLRARLGMPPTMGHLGTAPVPLSPMVTSPKAKSPRSTEKKRNKSKKERTQRRSKRMSLDADESYRCEEYQDSDADVEADEEYVERRSKSMGRKKRTSARKIAMPDTLDENDMPHSRQLLEIINSRDLVQIQSLHGFGAKKARDVVEYLDAMASRQAEDFDSDDANAAYIESIARLRTLPGMGGRTIERAYGGLAGLAA